MRLLPVVLALLAIGCATMSGKSQPIAVEVTPDNGEPVWIDLSQGSQIGLGGVVWFLAAKRLPDGRIEVSVQREGMGWATATAPCGGTVRVFDLQIVMCAERPLPEHPD